MKWPRANYGPNEEPRGCQGCGCLSTRVRYTDTEGRTMYRYRECKECGYQYTSSEDAKETL